MAVTGWEFTFQFHENENDSVGIRMKDIVMVEDKDEAKSILNEIWLLQTPTVLPDGTKIDAVPPTTGQYIVIDDNITKSVQT